MIDTIDLNILHELQVDASRSVADIAELCHLSKSACWRRIKLLEDHGVIREKTVLLDPEAMGLTLTVYIAIRTNQHNTAWAQKFRDVTNTLDNVLEVHRMSGDLDYLIKAVARDMKDYDTLYQQLIKADLYDVSASFVMEEIKHTTHLPIEHLRFS